MLYSSSREDLKRQLGVGCFAAEYAANVKAELSWDQVSAYISRDKADPSMMSDKERLVQEEKV
jgi:hypothetical protein